VTEQGADRRYPRARVPLLVQYRFSPLEEYQTDYSADVSRGGMFIYADQPHPVGTLLFIQFITRDGARIIRGQGRIVRAAAAEGPEARSGQAVEFLDFDEDDARFLEELVQEALVEPEKRKRRPPRRYAPDRKPKS